MLKVNPEELVREGWITLGTIGMQGGISASDLEGLSRNLRQPSNHGIDESVAGYKFVVLENRQGGGSYPPSVTSYSIIATQEKTPVVVVMAPKDITTLVMRNYLSTQLHGKEFDLREVHFQDFSDKLKEAEARAISGAADFTYEGFTLSKMGNGFLRHRTYARERDWTGEEGFRQILTLEPEVKDWHVAAVYMKLGGIAINLFDTGHAALWLPGNIEGPKLKAITDAATKMHNVFSAYSVN